MALKLYNKRWYPFIFIALSGVVSAGLFYFSLGHRVEVIIFGIGAVTGFVYFLYRQHLDETKLFKELFVKFNLRYDALNDHLNAILFVPTDGLLTPEEREHIFSYFNLCAEEFFFYKVGYIDRHVWKSWYNGMVDFFDHPRIRTLWSQDSKANSYYGFIPPE